MNTWKKFSEKRPPVDTEIQMQLENGKIVNGVIPSGNQTVWRSTERRFNYSLFPLDPKYTWRPIVGTYEKPAGRVKNKHHDQYETEEQFKKRVKFEVDRKHVVPELHELVAKHCAKQVDKEINITFDENPKDTIGSKKLPLSTLPWAVLAEAAAGMGEGAIKYGKHNYEVVGIRNSIYFDATLRHLLSWFLGEDIDPDSGIPHVTKALTSLLVLRDAQIYNNVTDDRPPACPPEHLEAVKDLFTSLTKDLKDCEKHYDRESIKRRSAPKDLG